MPTRIPVQRKERRRRVNMGGKKEKSHFWYLAYEEGKKEGRRKNRAPPRIPDQRGEREGEG